MPYIKIITIFLLIIISIISYISIQRDKQDVVPKKIELPEIKIPKKSIEFTITKDKDNNINFRGIFKEAKTAKNIAKLLDNSHLEHEIRINSRLLDSNKIITLLEKILKQFNKNYIEWSIIYKENKLLVSAKCKSIEDKERIETILQLSNINNFSNITTIPINEDLAIIANLKSIIESEKEQDTQTPTEDEVNSILSNLKTLVIQEKPQKKKIIKKKKIIRKKKIIKKKKKITYIKKYKHKKVLKDKVKIVIPTPRIYQKIEYNRDIISLPFVKTVDMDIEEEIKRGEIPPLKTKKPLVQKETIYIPSNEKPIDNNIPWAKLHNMDEKVDGIFIPEVINR
jgi:hypothetical protein